MEQWKNLIRKIFWSKDNYHIGMDDYKNKGVISAGDRTRQERKEKNMKRNWKRKLGIMIMLLAIMVTALPEQATAKTVDASKITFPTSGTMWSCDERIGDDDDFL